MAILGNKQSLIDDDTDKKEEYTVPVMVKKNKDGVSLKKSLFLSTILHPAVVGIIWLIVFILALMGITLSIFERPKAKMNDIEFVLVDNLKERTPLNKNTRFRSDKNTRTGGKRDPKRKVSMPSPSPRKSSAQQKSSPSQKQAKKPITKAKKSPKSVSKPKASKKARPAPPSARPSIKPPSIPKPKVKSTSPFKVPIPKGGESTNKTYSSGPIGGSGKAKTSGSTSGSKGGYAPTPSLAPTGGGSKGSKLSKGSSGYGNPGNPGGGGGAPGIDSIREPDFGPYMRELQRRIKMNWDPPKGNESKRVVLLFKIARDGRLLSVRVFKSSSLPNADKAALHAVELTAPFRPLPKDFRGNSIDIQFTFDYNVFGASGY